MTRSFRTILRLLGATTFVVMIGFSAWLLARPPHGRAADCATARAMWTYLETQLASERAAAQESNADNGKTEVAYRNMVGGLQAYADRIKTPDIRTKADAIVAINHDMFEEWKRWVAESQSGSPVPTGPTPSDEKHGAEFAHDGRRLVAVHAELERSCGR